jgi:putative ATP-dependent endonuclease of OLD family
MRISNINIEKFRSIDKATLEVGNLCALVGSNNVGKSTLLRALNSFFNFESEKLNFQNGSHDFKKRAIPKIDIILTAVPNRVALNDFKQPNGTLHLRLTFESSTKQKEKFQFFKNGGFLEFPKEAQLALKKEIEFVYIPTSRDYKETIFQEKTLLKELLDVYLKKHTERRNRIKPKIEDAVNYFNKYALKKASKELQNYYPLSREFDIQIDYDKSDMDYHILLRDLCIKIDDGKRSYNLIDTGSGIQSLVNIAIYRLLASLKHSNFIIGIEEPEVNLHPQSQREIIGEFKKSSESDSLQIIFTTHSAVVIDELEHSEIISFTRKEDSVRGYITSVSQIPQNFWELHGLDYQNYFQFYKYHNSEFFFSKFVIIVEGKGDVETVNYLLTNSDIKDKLQGLSILSLDGVQDLKYPFYLLKYLKIPYLIVVDKDFFVPYLNDSKEESRSADGTFRYKSEFNSKNIHLIEQIIVNSNERNDLLILLNSNHTKALDFLEKYRIVSMRYNLEMDLVSSGRAREQFYNIFNIIEENQTMQTLLTSHSKQIKKTENIMKVLKNLDNSGLPFSLSRIKRMAKKLLIE